MNRLHRFPLLLLLFSLSSCIEFEREELTYIHDEEKDELRVTLVYQGIFGNLDKGEYSQKNRNDVATHNSLNKLQIDQLESVLREKRAYFFNNWFAEYSKFSTEKMLKAVIKGNKQGRFEEPEKKLIELLHKNIEVRNIGFYENKNGKLCGGQTVMITNISEVIASVNQVIRRQTVAHIPQLRKELSENVPSAWSERTINLIEERLKEKFEFVRLEGNLITFSTIMAEAEQKKLTDSFGKDLPSGARVEFRDESIVILIGSKSDEVVHLSKNCFDGYQPNALNYIKEKHHTLVFSPKKINTNLTNFLKASGK
jgi:hypothetical protein